MAEHFDCVVIGGGAAGASVGGFPPVEPEDEEPAVDRPRFGFARLRGRGAPGDGSSKD
jgi:hypothetical protein